jgi:CRISPR-associated protein Cmr1
MRKPPTDEKGNLLTPPALALDLNKKRAGTETVELLTQVREYELLTPLFGGGVEAATADPVTVIRGSSVRGQLRFWWRACRGGQFNGDLKQMKKAENLLWGAASTGPSQVQIAIRQLGHILAAHVANISFITSCHGSPRFH